MLPKRTSLRCHETRRGSRRRGSLVPSLLLLTAATTAAATSRITPQTIHLNKSTLGPPSTLPAFGGDSSSLPAPFPTYTPTKISESCPDDIHAHAIQYKNPTLPYRQQHDYTCGGGCGESLATPTPGTLDVLELDSTSWTALIDQAHGGKIVSLVHKASKRELLFRNPVYQPGQLGRLGAWTSGGIEFNWPRLGHSVFTASPVFVAEISTSSAVDGGSGSGGDGSSSLLRIYEYDRELNSTFQVDLFADDDAAFYAHVKLLNPNAHSIDAYWWTNIAVPVTNTTRVLYDPSGLVVASGGPDGLACAPFPHYDENPGTLGKFGHSCSWPGACTGAGGRPTFGAFQPTDHSYPRNFWSARENFIRRAPTERAYSDRDFMAQVDTATGLGMVHVQTRQANGRKFWAWGNDPSDQARMKFLSSCDAATGACAGSYLEMQAGPAPTQEQTFTLNATSTFEWTEAWLPLALDPADVSGEYQDAVAAIRGHLDVVLPTSSFLARHTWLAKHADAAVSRVHAQGSGYGHLYEKMFLPKGASLKPGLDFSVAPNVAEWQAWVELLRVRDGTFSAETLRTASPPSFMVDQPWIDRLEASGAAHGMTWLHQLHLGISKRQQAEGQQRSKEEQQQLISQAMNHWKQSRVLQPNNVLAAFLLGDVAGAWNAVLARIETGDGNGGGGGGNGGGGGGGDADYAAINQAHLSDLARDVGGAFADELRLAKNWTGLAGLVQSVKRLGGGGSDKPLARNVSSRLLAGQPLRIAIAALATYGSPAVRGGGDPQAAIALLQDERGWAISTPDLVTIWQDAQYLIAKAKRGKSPSQPLTTLEKVQVRRSHPPPTMIDFGGAT